MGSGIFNIVLGIGFAIGGLTGHLALIGTGSGTALAVVGGGMAAYGVYQIVRAKRGA